MSGFRFKGSERQRSVGIPRLNGASQQAQGLIGFWSFLEGSGDLIRDLSVYNNHATLQAGALDSWDNTPKGPVVDFDGATDAFAVIGQPAILDNLTAFTASIWLNGTIPATPADLVFGGNHNQTIQMLIISGHTRFRSGDLSSGITNGVRTLSDNTDYLYTVTYDGATLRLYLNGTFDAEEAATGTITLSGNYNIAALNGTNLQFSGQLWHACMWNYALPPSAVWALYAPASRWDLLQPRIMVPGFVAAAAGSTIEIPSIGTPP